MVLDNMINQINSLINSKSGKRSTFTLAYICIVLIAILTLT